MISESHTVCPVPAGSDPVVVLCERLNCAKTAVKDGNRDLYVWLDTALYLITDHAGRPLSEDPVVLAAARALIGEVA